MIRTAALSALALALVSEVRADKICTGQGDPHYTSFDNYYYDFQGDCDYVFTKDCRTDLTLNTGFEAQVRNKRFSSTRGYPTGTGGVIVKVGTSKDIVYLNRDGNLAEVQTGGVGVFNTLTLPAYGSTDSYTDYEVSHYLEYGQPVIAVTVPDLGVTVSVKHPYWLVTATLADGSVLQGNTCGLCGDSDSNIGNEFGEVRNSDINWWNTPSTPNGLTNYFPTANPNQNNCFPNEFDNHDDDEDPDRKFREKENRKDRSRRQNEDPTICECPDDPESEALAIEFCQPLKQFEGVFATAGCSLYDVQIYKSCLCDFCYARAAAIGTMDAFRANCVVEHPELEESFPVPPEDCTPRHDSTDNIAVLCPNVAGTVGVGGQPDYTSDAEMCGGNKNKAKHGAALLGSMSNGLFGGSNSERDCKAWCLFDVRNGNHHFRWNNNRECWKHKTNRACTDSDTGERDFATDRQIDLCVEEE